ncbi:FKBP12-associated protein [Gamsiella multidivaricata]|nr:FKBP12-associated protein [Gamsiella multidivaricata]
MGDSPRPSNSNPSGAANTGSSQGNGSKRTPAKLNPDAKDYVPHPATNEGASGSSANTANLQAGGSNNNPRNRRRRNPDPSKAGSNNGRDSLKGEASKLTENGKKGGNRNNNTNNTNNTNNVNSTSSRSRRNRGHAPKQLVEGGARIDDDDDDDIEINMERPVEPTEVEAAGSEPALNSVQGSGQNTASSREGRRKGKEATNTSSARLQQNNRSDNGRSRANGVNRQAESSSSTRASVPGSNSSNNSRRQRNRKTGDLGGRTFPSMPISDQAGESSGSQRNAQRNALRAQPRKFVHKIEEDRDLMAALTAGLSNSTYDCMVCWDVIRPAHKVWNCQVCFAAFHLDCLSTWAKKSSEDPNNNGTGWRCPGCQNTQVSIPKEYVCFCGKISNPDFNRYLTPHSCAHAILDHALPAAASVPFSPVTVEMKLSSCAVPTRISHSRQESREQKCYCGKHEHQARCGDGEPRTTLVDGEERIGFYECHEICHRPLACGKHECTKTCHPLDEEPGQCPARPEVVKTCPCGSKTIETLLMGKLRTSCTDPIPVCGGLCKKTLNCGHRCMQKCHLGECQPCKMTVTVDCRCGSTRVQRVCSDMGMYGDERPTCDRLCRGLRTCGKHECTNRCCPAKNRGKGTKIDPVVLEAHICPLVCGKKLQCGVHTCEMLCHKGHCNPCLNSEPCPPCIMLVAKQCMCRNSKMPNVPCYKSNPSCGKVCGKGLECGLHKCIKSCHSGECISPPSDICTQACPKPRKSCGHRCGIACHGNTPCPEDQPCQTTVPSSCKCGHLTMESTCNATADNPWDGKLRIIKCNDYCLIAERNKRVALALEIEEGVSAPEPRIPDYDSYVLDYASANMEFTLKIEKQLAEWVADTSKPILYFPPMKGHRRKFVHELAAHYDVTSESVDVEPYRSVTVRRQLNTSVPDLLVSQACRQKRPATSTSSSAVEQLRKPMIKDPVNAIYLHDLAFGLTRSELAAQMAPVFGNIKYGIRWLTDDDAVLVPHPGSMQMDELEAVLVRLRTGIKSAAAKGNLCERVELCWVNKEGEVVSHTNVGSGSQSKRFFNASHGNQWATRTPPKVENTFALLDDDERIATAKRAEEERILKAKEAAGTLSSDAWEEEASTSSATIVPPAHTANISGSLASGLNLSQSSSVGGPLKLGQSQAAEDLTKFVVIKGGEFTDEVVDDWQDLIEDDDEDEDETETGDAVKTDTNETTQGDDQDKAAENLDEKKGSLSKTSSDDEGVLVSQEESPQVEQTEQP